MDKERYTTFYIIKNFAIFSFVSILTVLLLSLVMGCHSIPKNAIEQQEEFIRSHPVWKDQASEILQRYPDTGLLGLSYHTLLDTRGKSHEFKIAQIPLLTHSESVIIYCATHFVWEIITAKYNGKYDRIEYLIVEHPKNNK